MKLRLSPLFSDGMVLQRNADIVIHGWADCDGDNDGSPVQVFFDGVLLDSANPDETGKWECSLGSFTESCEPKEMRIVCGEEELIIRDILIGDVWLCAGQSNMEMALNRTYHNYPEEMTVTNPLIRQLKIPQVYKFDAPSDRLSDCAWESFSPKTAPNFTAVGYFFAKMLSGRYKIPLGLLSGAVGGVPIAAWMSRDMLKDFPNDLEQANECAAPEYPEYIEKTLRDYENGTRDYHQKLDELDEGFKQGFMNTQYDDTDWEEISVCAPVSGSGVYWYRKAFDVPQKLWGEKATVFMGTSVDMDEVYVNGEKIGTTYYRYPPREYEFTLPKGRLTVAVRLLCFGDCGGFTLGKDYFISTSKGFIDLSGGWKRRVGTLADSPESQTYIKYKPTGYFNGILSPISKYALSGVIWYQGESDTGQPARYGEKLNAMINGWRGLWGWDMPFLSVQLAYWDDAGNFSDEQLADWNRLREQQKRCLELPKTGVAAAYDLGEHNDLHPQNKRDVGERLARIAMRVAYGETLEPNVFEMYNCFGDAK